MPLHSLTAAEFQDPTAGGPGPDPASVCLALARAETQHLLLAHSVPPGPYCFSVFLRSRDRPGAITLVLRDAEGMSLVTVNPSTVWSRYDVMRESRTGDVSAAIFLREPGIEAPLLSDCLFSYPQLEGGRFPSSPMRGRPTDLPVGEQIEGIDAEIAA